VDNSSRESGVCRASVIDRATASVLTFFKPSPPISDRIRLVSFEANTVPGFREVRDELRALRTIVERMQANSTEREYLTLAETAEHLRISDRQLNQIRREGEVPTPITLGGKHLYTREQLDTIKRKLHILAGFTA